MNCPYCGGTDILYSPSLAQHYFRLLISSEKRYCPYCGKKWIARPKTRSLSGPWMGIILLIGIVSALMIDHLGSRSFQARKLQSSSPSMLSPKMMEKARETLKKDPDALQHLSPEKRKKAEAYMKKYGMELPR